VHEEARDAALLLPGELFVARPVAAQPDLDVAPGIDASLFYEPAHYGPVGEIDAEDLGPGVGVRVEVHEADGTVHLGAGAHVRLGDRMVPAQDYRDGIGTEHLPDRLPDGAVGAHGIGGEDGRVAVVDHPQLGERVYFRLELWPGRAARCPDGARREARPGPVGDELVHRGSHDRHVRAFEAGRVLRVRRASVRQRSRVIWLLADPGPTL
jgi:hypothetical protein